MFSLSCWCPSVINLINPKKPTSWNRIPLTSFNDGYMIHFKLERGVEAGTDGIRWVPHPSSGEVQDLGDWGTAPRSRGWKWWETWWNLGIIPEWKSFFGIFFSDFLVFHFQDPKKPPEIAAVAAPSKVGGLLLIVNWPRGEKTGDGGMDNSKKWKTMKPRIWWMGKLKFEFQNQFWAKNCWQTVAHARSHEVTHLSRVIYISGS